MVAKMVEKLAELKVGLMVVLLVARMA